MTLARAKVNAAAVNAAAGAKSVRGSKAAPLIGIVMGSSSDWDVMGHAVAMLAEFGVAHEYQVLSAHRMPDEMFAYAERAASPRASMASANSAALAAPASPMAKVATGMPLGICTME